jgi:hypothetical protein
MSIELDLTIIMKNQIVIMECLQKMDKFSDARLKLLDVHIDRSHTRVKQLEILATLNNNK